MLRKFLAMAMIVAPFSHAFSQDSTTTAEAPKGELKISGFVDAYYRFNFANTKKDIGALYNYLSFTNSQNSLELVMGSL